MRSGTRGIDIRCGLLRKRFEQRGRELGLTRSQWQVLAPIAPREGIHQGALAGILESEPTMLVRILDKPEARGLVERRRHATDRRLWLLHLKEAAHPILADMRELGEATRAEAFAGLPEAEREVLIETLTRMKMNLVEACNRPRRRQGGDMWLRRARNASRAWPAPEERRRRSLDRGGVRTGNRGVPLLVEQLAAGGCVGEGAVAERRVVAHALDEVHGAERQRDHEDDADEAAVA